MKEFDFRANNARQREISDRLLAINVEMENAEGEAREKLVGESADLRTELEILRNQREAALGNQAAASQHDTPVSKNDILRELLKSKEGGERVKREVTLSIINSGDKNNLRSGGAVPLTIKDLMPDLDEGLIFGKVGLQVQTGVKGDIIWPYATSAVQMEEVGETVALTDQDINFDKITVSPQRLGATIAVSNEAIDDASFDLMAYVQQSLTRAQQRHLNKKTFGYDSNFTGLKGPFASQTPGTLVCNYQSLLEAKAAIIDAGVDMADFCWVLDAHAEAALKATPKAEGQGGFIIENGKLDGDPYFVSHYIRSGASAQSADLYIGCGSWSYFAANQHGDVRLIVDPFTQAVKNETLLTINTRWSLTTLRPEAFAIYKLVTGAPVVRFMNPTTTVVAGQKVTNKAYANPNATVTYTSGTTSKATVNSATGEVTGVAAGTSVITATITVNGSSYTDTYTITVTAS